MTCWIIIPARKGTKRKNLWLLDGKPLIHYALQAARAWGKMRHLIVTTDDPECMIYARDMGVTVISRSPELSQDDTPIIDVVRDIVDTPVCTAETVVLLQPTSPFVLPDHINECCRLLWHNHEAASAQTVVEVAHNDHAFNQRRLYDYETKIEWAFPTSRSKCYNKQLKPKFHKFGNCLAFRPEHALEQNTVFPEPSLPAPINRGYDLDADDPWHLRLGEVMLQSGMVELRHLEYMDDVTSN